MPPKIAPLDRPQSPQEMLEGLHNLLKINTKPSNPPKIGLWPISNPQKWEKHACPHDFMICAPQVLCLHFYPRWIYLWFQGPLLQKLVFRVYLLHISSLHFAEIGSLKQQFWTLLGHLRLLDSSGPGIT